MRKIPALIDASGRLSCPVPIKGPSFLAGTNYYVANSPTDYTTDWTVAGNRTAVINANAVNTSTGYTWLMWHFPGWSTPGGGQFSAAPWQAITDEWQARKPLLGYYDETAQWVVDNELRWMYEFGVDVIALVVFCDFSSGSANFKLEHWLQRYLASTVNPKPKICLGLDHKAGSFLAAASGSDTASINTNLARFTQIINHYVKAPADGETSGLAITSRSDYFKINGKPVFYIVDAQDFHLKRFMSSSNVLTALTNGSTIEDAKTGSGGFFWVAGCSSAADFWVSTLKKSVSGYDAIGAYNVSRRYTGDTVGAFTPTNYAEYALMYYGLTDAALGGASWGRKMMVSPPTGFADKVICPASAGWAYGPWQDPLGLPVGVSYGYPRPAAFWWPSAEELKTHLIACKAQLDFDAVKSMLMFSTYSWNEYGEGGFFGPTVGNGMFDRLQVGKDVFGK